MSDEQNPTPITIEVCEVCGEMWTKHLHMTRTVDYDDDERSVTTYRPVNLGDCVTLLKSRHQGPPGPPGAMGPMGSS